MPAIDKRCRQKFLKIHFGWSTTRWGPNPLKGHSRQSVAHVCCGQTAGCIKMPLGTEVGLDPGHIVLDGTHCVRWDPAPPKMGQQPPIFGPRLLWPNGWMDQDATWCGGRPEPWQHCISWGPSPPPKGAQLRTLFGSCLLWPNGRPSQLLLSICLCLFYVVVHLF